MGVRIVYDKDEVKEALEPEDIYAILEHLEADPEYKEDVVISRTICHDGDSHKLYYYPTQKLFHCYTDCDASFDIFELLNKTLGLSLNDAVNYIVTFFNLQWKVENDTFSNNEDIKLLKHFQDLHEIKVDNQRIELPSYEEDVLLPLPQPRIANWEDEFITYDAIKYMGIKYDPIHGAIVIPHRDIDGRLVGIRQRTLVEEEAQWGKYRPWKHGKKMYNHPLAFNLYGLDKAKDNIAKMRTVLVMESEKSVLQAIGYLGQKNNIAVACCGSNLSKYQVQQLIDCGAKSLVVGFDADYSHIGDEDYWKVTEKLSKIYYNYAPYINISFLLDKRGLLLKDKQSPTDLGKQAFMYLWENKVYVS